MTTPSHFSESINPLQRRLIVSALVLLALVVITGVLFGVFLLLRSFVNTFSGVLWPLAVAGILTMILRPVVLWLQRRLKLGRIKAIILLFLLVVVVLAGLGALVLPVLFEQTLIFIQKLPVIWENLRSSVSETFPQVQAFLESQLGPERLARYEEALRQQVGQLAGVLVPAAQDLFEVAGSVVAWAAGAAIVPVYLFFFLLTDRDPTTELREQLSFVRSEWRDDIIFLVREFVGSMEAFFRGQILIGLIMGVLLAIGFSVGGVNFGIGLGLMIGALNIIPYFGTIVGLGTVLPIAYFQPDGGFARMCVALGIFVAVQMLEGYVLTPRIMGQRTGLHPLVIIIAIFFWGVALGGLLGMILAIPLTAFFVVAWRLVKRKYLNRLAQPEGTPQDALL